MKLSTDLYPELKSPQDVIDALDSLQTPVSSMREIAVIFQLCKYMFKGQRPSYDCELDDTYSHMCVLRVTVNQLVLENTEWFNKIIEVSSNTRISATERGRVVLEITFYGINEEV